MNSPCCPVNTHIVSFQTGFVDQDGWKTRVYDHFLHRSAEFQNKNDCLNQAIKRFLREIRVLIELQGDTSVPKVNFNFNSKVIFK